MALGVCSRPAGSTSLRGCLKSLHGFLQRYPHAMVIVDFRELRTIVTSSEAALHQLKTLMSGLFKQPLRAENWVLHATLATKWQCQQLKGKSGSCDTPSMASHRTFPPVGPCPHMLRAAAH